jgi:hypothetical protein
MAPFTLIWTREDCGQLYALGSSFLEKEPPVCIEKEEGWVSELVWIYWTGDDNIAPRGSKPITTQITRLPSSMHAPFSNWFFISSPYSSTCAFMHMCK